MDQTKQAPKPDDMAWGCTEIGKEIGRSPTQAFHLCSKGYLPVKKVGGRWVGNRKRLRQCIGMEVE
jgi:hypothetical protein